MPISPVADDRWQKRATRARRLAGERPVVAAVLDFYADLAEAQEDLVERHAHALIGGAGPFADRLDHGVVFGALPAFLRTIARLAPAPFVDALPAIQEHDRDRWRHRIQTYWITGGREAWDADEMQQFVLEALLQPFAETVAATFDADSGSGGASLSADLSAEALAKAEASAEAEAPPDAARECPICSGTPVVAMLREQGHGARRSLVCGLCLTEWPALRLVCVACGESRFGALPNFRADEFATARVDACESCTAYLKTIDLTRDGSASPIVDDVASLPLDLWARGKGYHRNRRNLLRL